MRPPVLPYEPLSGEEVGTTKGNAPLLCGTASLVISCIAPLFRAAAELTHPANRFVLLAALLALALSLLGIVSAVRHLFRDGTDNARVLVGLVMSTVTAFFPLKVAYTLLSAY